MRCMNPRSMQCQMRLYASGAEQPGESKKSRNKEKFLRGHESDIILICNSNDAPTFFVVDDHTLF